MIETFILHTAERGELQTHTLRAITTDGERWFFAIDLCRVLNLHVRSTGLPNTAVALRHLDARDKCVRLVRVLPTITARTALVNDTGLYKLVLRSPRKAPPAFTKWVKRNVSPTIGAALAIEAHPTPLADALRDRAAALSALADRLEQA